MKRSYSEAPKEEENCAEIGEPSVSVTSSAKSLNLDLDHLYKTIPNSARNERGKKLRLEKASVSCSFCINGKATNY